MNEIVIDVTGNHFQSLMPALILAGFGLLILLLDAFQRGGSRRHLAYFAFAGFACAGVASYFLWQHSHAHALFGDMVYMDGYAQAMSVIFVVAGALTCLVARDYLVEHDMDRGEFYVLLLFAVFGMVILAGASDLITVFLGLETMSISLYVLASFDRSSRRSAEAGLKYLILGALSTGVLLYGIAMVYGVTGTTNLREIGDAYYGQAAQITQEQQAVLSDLTLIEAAHPSEAIDAVGIALATGHVHEAFELIEELRATAYVPGSLRGVVVEQDGQVEALAPIAFLGMLLILVAFGFKVAAAPFHMWAPDVYTGTPTPAVGFMATAVKAAGFAALVRILLLAFFDGPARMSPTTGWVPIVVGLALLSMVVGNVAAIVQDNIKRMLAYSSVAHAGYVLVAITAAGFAQEQQLFFAVVFYLVAYLFGTLGAFGVLTLLGRKGEQVETYDDLDGLATRHPWLSASMTVFMLSAAGIPPTAGFLAKFYVFKIAIDAAATGGDGGTTLILVAVVGILASVAGVYYYLRVIVHMYMKQATRIIRPLVSRPAAFAVGICVIATLWFGLLPNRLTTLSVLSVARAADTMDGPEARPFSDDELEQAELEP